MISACDVCISPEPRNALNEHSTLMKVAEDMPVGRPVVAFDLRETRRTAGEAAVYASRDDPVAFAEAIAEVLDDDAKREPMAPSADTIASLCDRMSIGSIARMEVRYAVATMLSPRTSAPLSIYPPQAGTTC